MKKYALMLTVMVSCGPVGENWPAGYRCPIDGGMPMNTDAGQVDAGPPAKPFMLPPPICLGTGVNCQLCGTDGGCWFWGCYEQTWGYWNPANDVPCDCDGGALQSCLAACKQTMLTCCAAHEASFPTDQCYTNFF